MKTLPIAMSSRFQFRLFTLIFFLSGATSLIYQIAWMRQFSLFFGSDVYSAAVTLAAFMGGLGLGSWAAGRLAKGMRMPMFAYGLLEILISIYAYIFPELLQLFDPVLTEAYKLSFQSDPFLYQSIRASTAFFLLLPPTAMMGATLPLVVQHFATSDAVLGARLGHFYSSNTIGALAGTLIGGFFLLPVLGVYRTGVTTALVNLAIGICSLWLAGKSGPVAVVADDTVVAKPKASPRRSGIPLAMALSGFGALALEVVWTRVLVQSFSATVYAFSIMLACFLLGIFVGSKRESRVVDAQLNPIERLIRLELWLFAYVAFLCTALYLVPGFFGLLLWGFTNISGGAFGVSSLVAQGIAASSLILLPTYWLGATFPVAVKAYTADIDDRAPSTGRIYSANTLGALCGALAAGFLLIPILGTTVSIVAISLCFLGSALILQPMARSNLPRLRMIRTRVLIAGVVFAAVGMLLPRQIVVNFNMQQTTRPEVVYHGEGIAHTVDIVKTSGGNTLMMVNGNVEADTTLVQRRHFILKAHLPLLLHPNPKDIAVIGLGLGMTLSATARNPLVERIRVIELTPEMVVAHKYLKTLTNDILSNPKVNLIIDDGRNFLRRSSEKFDMITADPIHPRISGVGYLYTTEYYEAVKSRLSPGGYILQWMPMYAISRESFDTAFRTFAGVFPNASFWYVRGHGLFVAGENPLVLDFAILEKRFNNPLVLKDFESIGIRTVHELIAHLMMDSGQILRYLDDAATRGDRLNSDDNSSLEYRTPHEFLQRTKSIIEGLKPFSGWARDRLKGATPLDVSKIEQFVAVRERELLEELNRPVQ